MPEKNYTEEELNTIALEIIDMLRPKHLRIADIREILHLVNLKLEFVVLREKTNR